MCNLFSILKNFSYLNKDTTIFSYCQIFFLFIKNFKVEGDEMGKIVDADSQNVLKVALTKLEPVQSWDHVAIESVLRVALIEELGLKPSHPKGRKVRLCTRGGVTILL